MAASFNSYPGWVQSSKRKVLKSDEWLNFTKDLFDTVSLDMKDNGVRTFSSLTVNEKKLMMQKAVSKLNNNDSYKQLTALVSSNLNNELNEKFAQSSVSPTAPSVDLYTTACEDAIAAILTKWPSAKSRFIRCFNVELSNKLRYIIWSAQLKNVHSQRQYTELASSSPHRLASAEDADISIKCHNLLKSNATLKPLLRFRQAASVLRHVVSYDHSRWGETSRLNESDYALAIPFVYLTLNSFSADGKEALTMDIMSHLIEQHQSFIQKKPDYVKSPTIGRSLLKFSSQVISLLPDMKSMFDQIKRLYHSSPGASSSETSESSLSHLLQPFLRSYFVGYAPLDIAMFIIDQQVIGYDLAAGVDVMPYVVAALLALCHDGFKDCTAWREVEPAFIKSLSGISADQIVSTVQSYGWRSTLLSQVVSQKNPDLIAPTRTDADVKFQPWRYWDSEKLLKYYRDSVVQKPKRATEEQIPPYNPVKEESVEDLQSDSRQQMYDNLEEMSESLRDTQNLLDEERRSKADIIESAEVEIKRLKDRILHLENRNAPSSFASTYMPTARSIGLTDPEYEDGSVFGEEPRQTPPVSAKSSRPVSQKKDATPSSERVAEKVPTPQETESVRDESSPARQESEQDETTPKLPLTFTPDQVMRMLLTKMIDGSKLITHGYPDEKQSLDVQTQENLAAMRRAYNSAKISYFNGNPPSSEDFALLPVDQKKKITERLNEMTKTNLIKSKGK